MVAFLCTTLIFLCCLDYKHQNAIIFYAFLPFGKRFIETEKMDPSGAGEKTHNKKGGKVRWC